ncbi:MAG: hypothetical protein ABI650_04555 [Dokdonella sp.]
MKAAVAAAVLAFAASALIEARADSPCVGLTAMPALELRALRNRDDASTRRTLDFASVAHCLEDAEARRAAVLVAITARGNVQVNVTALADRKKGLLPLVVSVLDANRQVTSRFDGERFVHRGMRHTLSFHLPDSDESRYLLVEKDRRLVGQSAEPLILGVRSTVFWATPAVVGAYARGNEQTVQLPFADTGKFEVELVRIDAGAGRP